MPTESDNHADTHAFVSSFRPITWYDQHCTVSTFMSDLGSTDNVKLFVTGTVWTHQSEDIYILLPGIGLCFGPKMPHRSLINPNQCRSYGISFCDDPSDPHRELGIYSDEHNLQIDMQMNRSFATMLTRCPIEDEKMMCTHIILGNCDHWDPDDNNFSRDRSPQHIHAISVMNHNTRTSQTTNSEFDSIMSSISTSLSPNTLVEAGICTIHVDLHIAPNKQHQRKLMSLSQKTRDIIVYPQKFLPLNGILD